MPIERLDGIGLKVSHGLFTCFVLRTLKVSSSRYEGLETIEREPAKTWYLLQRYSTSFVI